MEKKPEDFPFIYPLILTEFPVKPTAGLLLGTMLVGAGAWHNHDPMNAMPVHESPHTETHGNSSSNFMGSVQVAIYALGTSTSTSVASYPPPFVY